MTADGLAAVDKGAVLSTPVLGDIHAFADVQDKTL